NGPAFREVWVVSGFVKRAFVGGGVKPERVRVVRPPVCDGPWEMGSMPKLIADKSRPVTPDDPYVFGAMGTWHSRKGFPDLIRAFFGAFKREDPVQLVIRTSAFGENLTIREMKKKLTDEIALIAEEFGDDDFPNSKAQPHLKLIIGTDATDQEVIEWLSSIDCYANATYGEGLGIPHVWAKANGVPMVTSSFGAVGEMIEGLCDMGADDEIYESHVEPVDPEMCRIALMFDPDTKWAKYDPKDLGTAMTMQYEKGRRFDEVSAEITRDLFSVEKCAAEVRKGVREIVGEERSVKWEV
ncbi:MAG: hypothetical protein DRH08_00175, partial [Deltaproteobacteria bacterium]